MNILCLKDYSERIEKSALELNLNISFMPVIEIKPLLKNERMKELLGKKTDFVFTSSNAVNILKPFFKSIKGTAFCVGEKSEELLKPFFERIISAQNINELSEKILKDSPERLLHFKGNLSLSYLGEAIAATKIEITEETVYNTLELGPKVEQLDEFDALLFFSPSGVRSFLKENKLPNAIIGAIGSTTAESIPLEDVVVPKINNANELLRTISQQYDSLARI